jgi:hypothetical protein
MRGYELQVPDLESREREPGLLLARLVGHGCINFRTAMCHRKPTRDLLLLEICDNDSCILCQLHKDVPNLHTKTD